MRVEKIVTSDAPVMFRRYHKGRTRRYHVDVVDGKTGKYVRLTDMRNDGVKLRQQQVILFQEDAPGVLDLLLQAVKVIAPERVAALLQPATSETGESRRKRAAR